MNFYWFKLDLVRLKLTYNPEAWYIYFLFLDPITDQDLLKDICFIFFWVQTKSVQFLQLCSSFELIWNLWKGLKPTGCIQRWPSGTVPMRPTTLFRRGPRRMAAQQRQAEVLVQERSARRLQRRHGTDYATASGTTARRCASAAARGGFTGAQIAQSVSSLG
jgi:hypothetical protein